MTGRYSPLADRPMARPEARQGARCIVATSERESPSTSSIAPGSRRAVPDAIADMPHEVRMEFPHVVFLQHVDVGRDEEGRPLPACRHQQEDLASRLVLSTWVRLHCPRRIASDEATLSIGDQQLTI